MTDVTRTHFHKLVDEFEQGVDAAMRGYCELLWNSGGARDRNRKAASRGGDRVVPGVRSVVLPMAQLAILAWVALTWQPGPATGVVEL